MTDQTLSGPSVAIMQPYIFPYLGYFQLAEAADVFVFYDDVQFMKGGWVNRNRISNQGKPLIFTIPIRDASMHRQIMDVSCGINPKFLKKFMRQIEQEYRKAPHFDAVAALVQNTLDSEHQDNMAQLAITSVENVFSYLEAPLDYSVSSRDFPKEPGLRGPERVIKITHGLGGKRYINLPGGVALYSTEQFEAEGIDLKFIQTESGPYPQFKHDFIPKLSIIDILMHNDPATVRAMLGQYRLLSAEEAAANREPASPTDQPPLPLSKDA